VQACAALNRICSCPGWLRKDRLFLDIKGFLTLRNKSKQIYLPTSFMKTERKSFEKAFF